MPVGQGSLAGYARVAYEATGLADFENDNRRAEAVYRDTTRGMSDEAIRLELSQDKLRRSLAKGPAAYREQARAELQLRNSERALRGETDALTRSQSRNTAGLGGLKRSIIGLGAAYVGAQGVLTLTRASVAAAREEELVRGQTKVAIESLGLSYDAYSTKIDRTIKQVQQLGFDDEDLAKSFQLLARSADSPEQALDQLGLAADVARGRYIDLEQATNIVNKANLGMSGSLRRIGLDVDKDASSFELLTALQRGYGLAAEEAMDTGVAAADRFSVAVEEIQEVLGGGLAPALADVSDRVSEWVSREENMERVQRQVNDAVETGEEVVRGIAGAFKLARTVAEPFIDLLGGTENAVKALGIAWIAMRTKAILGFGGTAAASSATTAKLVRDAAIAGRAWDVATRPRVMPVTVVGGGVPGAGGKGGGKIPFVPGFNLPTAVAVAVLAASGASGVQEVDVNDYPLTRDLMNRVAAGGKMNATERRLWKLLDGSKSLDQQSPAVLAKIERGLRKMYEETERPGEGFVHPPSGGKGGKGGAGAKGGFTFKSFETQLGNLEEDALDAAATPGTADDLRIERRRLQLARRALRELELTRDQRLKVKAERNRALQAIAAAEAAEDQEAQAIRDKQAAKRAAAKEAAEKKAAKEEAAEKAQMEKVMKRAQEHYERMQKLTKGTDFSTRKGLRDAALRGLKGGGNTEADKARALQDQVRSSQFEFLSELRGTMNQFGGNLFAPGSLQVAGAGGPNPELFSMITELREQTGLLAGLASGVRQPGTRYARTELSAAFEGPTF